MAATAPHNRTKNVKPAVAGGLWLPTADNPHELDWKRGPLPRSPHTQALPTNYRFRFVRDAIRGQARHKRARIRTLKPSTSTRAVHNLGPEMTITFDWALHLRLVYFTVFTGMPRTF